MQRDREDERTGRGIEAARRVRPTAILFTLVLALATAGIVYLAIVQPQLAEKPQVLATRLPEPSGIVFHPARKSLFVVGDEGAIAEMTPDGGILRDSGLAAADFEGVTVHPATGNLYALAEGENTIVEIDPATLEIRRQFSIDGRFGGENLIPPGAEGLEGIAFVPDRDRPHGGRFFVANRGPVSERNRPEAGHTFLAELNVPLDAAPGSEPKATIVGAVACRVADVSDLSWVADPGALVAISDRLDALVELRLDGTVKRTSSLPGRRQEGIAFDAAHVYIAQDSGGVLKLPRP